MQVDGNISRFPRQWEFGVSFQLMRVYPTVTAGSTFNAVQHTVPHRIALPEESHSNVESGVGCQFKPWFLIVLLRRLRGDSSSLNRS